MLPLLLCATVFAPQAGPIALGPSKLTLEIRGTPLEVFLHRPKSYKGDRMIVVMHGTLRNADEYRDHSAQMAERFGALIVAPKFDEERFPSARYHYGGILSPDRRANPRDTWTYHYVVDVVNRVRTIERKPKMPYYLIGHSAGGQFLVRLAAFFKCDAERIVAANAGSQLFPSKDFPFPYGIGNMPPELSSDDVLKGYLAQPLTLYLGSADNGPDQYFDRSAPAMRQGGGRYERNLRAFEAAKKLAAERGWPFHWRVVVARGIGHDHELMFNHPQADLALFGKHWPYRR